jgi:hypothetical protein
LQICLYSFFRLAILKINSTNNGGKEVRKIRKRSFHELVRENRQALLHDQQALDKIEERLEARLEMRRMEKAE